MVAALGRLRDVAHRAAPGRWRGALLRDQRLSAHLTARGAGHPGLVAPCLAALNTSQLAAAFIVAVVARRGASSRITFWPCAARLPSSAWRASSLAPAPLAIVGPQLSGSALPSAFIVALTMPALLAGPDDVHRLGRRHDHDRLLSAFLFPLAGGSPGR